MFNVYKSRRSDVLTTLPERVVHGLCEDSAAGAVSGVVNIAGPAVGFCGVCGAVMVVLVMAGLDWGQ